MILISAKNYFFNQINIPCPMLFTALYSSVHNKNRNNSEKNEEERRLRRLFLNHATIFLMEGSSQKMTRKKSQNLERI